MVVSGHEKLGGQHGHGLGVVRLKGLVGYVLPTTEPQWHPPREGRPSAQHADGGGRGHLPGRAWQLASIDSSSQSAASLAVELN